MKKLLLLSLILFFTHALISQNWSQQAMHGGGFVTGLIPDPSNAAVLYARIDVGGVYKTSDGGDNWTSITQNMIKDNKYNYYVRSLALDIDDASTLFISTGHAPYDDGSINQDSWFWKTSDSGNSWTRITPPCNFSGNGLFRYAGETIVQNPLATNDLYVGGQGTWNYGSNNWNTDSGLFHFDISSNTWTEIEAATFQISESSQQPFGYSWT